LSNNILALKFKQATSFFLMKNRRHFYFLYGFLLFMVCFSANAADAPGLQASQIKDWAGTLARAEQLIQKADLSDENLEGVRSDLLALRVQVVSAINAAEPETQRIKDELSTLGPLPAADAPKELPTITAKRKTINDELAAADGVSKEAGLTVTRIDHILLEISSLRRTRFAERIRSRSQSPLSPALWKKAGAECLDDWSQFSASLKSFWANPAVQSADFSSMAYMLGAGALLFLALFVWLRRWAVARASSLTGEPTQGQRLEFALVMGLIRALVPSAIVLSFYLVLRHFDILPDSAQEFVWASVTSLSSVFLIAAVCRSVLTPFSPRWRLIGATSRGSRSISFAIIAIAVVFALDNMLDELRSIYGASLELTIIQKFISGLSIAAILLLFLKQSFWQQKPSAAVRPSILGPHAWGWVRVFLHVLVLAIPLSAALGYVALSRLMATQIVLTLGLFIGGALTRGVLAETIRHILAPETASAAEESQAANGDNDSNEMLIFWVTVFVNLLVVILAIVVLLFIWGAGGSDLGAWLYEAFFGIKIGSLSISPSNLLLAAVLFVVFGAFTRFLQRTLEQSVFPRTRLDIGLRNSIRATVGYVGFVLATLLAASTVGLNLSSLAMIAGALSVGIGFGLQNIISNFVSGLILLVERPIKVGDWVVVGEYQGYVRKISVRATELTTFDRASVFIPNSNLIASPVMNRTHADRDGRIILPVGVAYGSDTNKVRELLLDIAREHGGVKINPPPGVLFRSFGSDALQFELVAYIYDVDKLLGITSDLCFSIDKVLREHQIAIPFPQRDVHLGLQEKQLEAILKALSGHQNPAT
jgi:potassium efflux system protein